MSIFKKDESLQETQEYSFDTLPTGAYKGKLEQVYLRSVPAGANSKDKDHHNLNLYYTVKTEKNGQQISETFGVFIGKIPVTAGHLITDGSLNTNAAQSAKFGSEGKEYMAFTRWNKILRNLTGKSIFESDLEVRIVPIYNFNTKKDEPTPVLSVVSALGSEGVFGIYKQLDVYNDKVRESNFVSKAWGLVNEVPFTFEERQVGLTEPKDLESWLSANEGKENKTARYKEFEKSGGTTKSVSTNAGSTAQQLEIG